MAVLELDARRADSFTIGKKDELSEALSTVRIMITMAIGTLKEIKAQVHEKPGVRFLIGEILSCLGSAQKATSVRPEQLNFKKL